jgi:hypothetical protein
MFYGVGLLAPYPTPKVEEHPLSAVRCCLFNIFTAIFRIWRPSPPCINYTVSNGLMTVNDILDMIKKEAVRIYFKSLSQQMHGTSESFRERSWKMDRVSKLDP